MYLDITIYVFERVHRAIVFISILIIIVLHTYLVQSSLFYIYLQEDRRLLSLLHRYVTQLEAGLRDTDQQRSYFAVISSEEESFLF